MSSPSPLTPALERAHALVASGDLPSAVALLERAVEVGRENLGEDSPDVLATQRELAVVHRRAGDAAAARRVLETAYAAGQWRLGDADPLMLQISYDLGLVAAELGNRHEARKAFGRVAGHGPAVLGAGHWAIARARAHLAQDQQPTEVRGKAQSPPLPHPPSVPPQHGSASKPASLPAPPGPEGGEVAGLGGVQSSAPAPGRPAGSEAAAPPDTDSHPHQKPQARQAAESRPTVILPAAEKPAVGERQAVEPAVELAVGERPAVEPAVGERPAVEPALEPAVEERPTLEPPVNEPPTGEQAAGPWAAPPARTVGPNATTWQATPAVDPKRPATTGPSGTYPQESATTRPEPAWHPPDMPRKGLSLPTDGSAPQSRTPEIPSEPEIPSPPESAPTDPPEEDALTRAWRLAGGDPQASSRRPPEADPQSPPPEPRRSTVDQPQGLPIRPPETAPERAPWQAPRARQQPNTTPETAAPWATQQPPEVGRASTDLAMRLPDFHSGTATDPHDGTGGKSRTGLAVILVVLATVAAFVAVAALVFVLVERGGTPVPQGAPPTGLSIVDQGSSVEMTWTAPPGDVPFMVMTAPPGETLRPVAPVAAGQTSFVVEGLDEGVDHCFAVAAVYGTDRYAGSDQVCTRRERAVPK